LVRLADLPARSPPPPPLCLRLLDHHSMMPPADIIVKWQEQGLYPAVSLCVYTG